MSREAVHREDARGVLVTGGGGFIGAWTIAALLEGGHVPIVLDVGEPSSFVRRLIGPRLEEIRWVTGDIADEALVDRLVGDADAVIHLAGVLMPFCRANPVAGARINVVGSTAVFAAAARHGVSGVAYASSAAVYSPTALEAAPRSLYGAYKRSVEVIAEACHAEFGLSSAGIRPLVVYGPGRESGASAGITLACRAAAGGAGFEIEQGGLIDAVYVADVADAFVKSALDPVPGAHSWALSGRMISVEEVAAIIEHQAPGVRITAGSGALGIHPDLSGQDLRGVRDDIRLTSLEDGIALTLAYYAAAS